MDSSQAPEALDREALDREALDRGAPKRVRVGSLDELKKSGCMTTKAGSRPVCVFWDDGRAYAVEDRCPHMGFPLHKGTVRSGLLTCHWHHARFDLVSGGTLDPWADDVRSYPVEVDGDDVSIVVGTRPGEVERLRRRLDEGMEQGLTLVTSKAVIGLLSAGVDPSEIVEAGVQFGIDYRGPGWGSGLTVLVAMANALGYLDPADRPLALVHGLVFMSNDTRGHRAHFALEPLASAPDAERLAAWYRQFIDTRSADAAERVLATSVMAGQSPQQVADMMLAAVTDHVFIDEGHVLDFTNKAFESLKTIGWHRAIDVLPTLVGQTANARRHEEESAWRHPDDLAGILQAVAVTDDLAVRLDEARAGTFTDDDVNDLAWAVLSDTPEDVVGALDRALDAGAAPEQLARAVAYAAALRIVRFHTQNDHTDWNDVHHAFTSANALHQSMVRAPSPELVRGVYQCALRVYLDRFLNVPAARLPRLDPEVALDASSDVSHLVRVARLLRDCWDVEGNVNVAGHIVYNLLRHGDDATTDAVIAALGRQLLTEDSQFHWYQIYEAALAQFRAWPPNSEQRALVMTAAARFLAAHTPTRRELSHIFDIAVRLRRGEPLYEDPDDAPPDEAA